MCPADDAHLTLEFSDYYMIKPTIVFNTQPDFSISGLGEKGQPVPDGFCYDSSTNPDVLSVDQIRTLLEKV